MEMSKEKYTLKIINTEEGCNFARLAHIDKKVAVEHFHFRNSLYQKNWSDMLKFTHEVNNQPQNLPNKHRDTLIHALGDFVEYTPQAFTIKKPL